MENELAKDLRSAGAMVKYDAQVKKVLSSKIILAWIMHYTIGEFAGLAPAEIIPYIAQDGIPVKCYPEKVTGLSNEDKEPGEGAVYYDIRFFAYLPGNEEERGRKESRNHGCLPENEEEKGWKESQSCDCLPENGKDDWEEDQNRGCLPENVKDEKEREGSRNHGCLPENVKDEKEREGSQSHGRAKIILDVEAQKSFYPGYPIESRGVFYCSRLVASQIGREFVESHYADIKKVYSIWLCMNAPKYIGNAIAEYSFSKTDIVPGMPDRREAYDKQSVIRVCLNEDCEPVNELSGMLNTLLSSTMEAGAKIEKLEKEYGIPMNREMEEEVRQMCNLSEWVLETGWKKGMAEGKELGMAEGKELGMAEGKELGMAEGKELGMAKGKELGMAEGKELGKELGMESIVKKMLLLKTNGEEQIIQLTGISRKRLEELKAQIFSA